MIATTLACSSTGQGTPDAGGGDAGDVDGAPPPAYVCTVASTGTSGVVLTGRVLLPSGPIDGEVFVDGNGVIACAGASCASSAGYDAATHLACPGGVISPSLINPHDHINFATSGPVGHGTTRYQHRHDWRTGAEGAKALPTPKSTTDTKIIAAAELRFVLGGATAVVSSGGVRGLMRDLANYSDTSQLEGLTGKTAYYDTFPLGDANGTLLSSGCGYPNIRKASSAFQDGQYVPHVGEGINLAAENELTCESQQSNDIITARTSIIHGVGFNAKDVDVVRQAGAKVIWSPRSNISLYGDTAPVTEYKAAGVTIALGTDWLASGSMNMLRELACADSLDQKYFHQAFSDQQLWAMVTINAAVAAGFDSQIGSLEVGKVADVAVFDGRVHADYRAVIAAGAEDVHLVLRGGKPLYGDADLVDALQTGCAAMDVCGNARAVCLDVPSVTLADVQAAASSIYPLFFCRDADVTDEPSCVPYRDSYPDGTSATDGDGDGVPDATDDCPTVFNPPRPMDGAAQADVDSDGFGDACDAKPLDPGAH